MNEEFRKMLSNMVGYPVDISFKQIFEKDGIAYSDITALMQYKQLSRIADALEIINSQLAKACDRLQSIEETLDSCICKYGNNNFLCITGNVSTN